MTWAKKYYQKEKNEARNKNIEKRGSSKKNTQTQHERQTPQTPQTHTQTHKHKHEHKLKKSRRKNLQALYL